MGNIHGSIDEMLVLFKDELSKEDEAHKTRLEQSKDAFNEMVLAYDETIAKQRVEIEMLKGLNDGLEKHMISQNDLITKQQSRFRQTKKLLKESNEHMVKLIGKIATKEPKKVLEYIKGYEHIYGITDQVDFLSKLNKD